MCNWTKCDPESKPPEAFVPGRREHSPARLFEVGWLGKVDRRQIDLWNIDLHLVGIDLRQSRFVVHDHAGEHDHRDHHEDLNHNEWRGAPINLAGRHARCQLAGDTIEERVARRHGAQIEQRETERRMQERGLHVDAENDAEPYQIDAEMFRRRAEQRYDDEGQFEIIEKERQHKDEGIDEKQEADLAAGQRSEQAFDPDVPADAIESQREDPRADQDEDDERRQFRGGLDRLANQIPGQTPFEGTENERAAGAHGATLGGRSDADEDGAEHEENQEQRRHHDESRLLRHPRQEAESGEALDGPVHDGHAEGEKNTEEHAEHDEVGAMRLRIAHHEPAEHRAGNGENEQRPKPAAAVVLAKAYDLHRQTGRRLWEKGRNDESV